MLDNSQVKCVVGFNFGVIGRFAVCEKESEVCLVNIWTTAVQMTSPRMLTFMWKTSPRTLGLLLVLLLVFLMIAV